MTKAKPVCDKDCFHCPHPDCILDALDHEDYLEAAQREREYIAPRTAQQKKVAAKQKAYREANREKWNSYMREYRQRKRRPDAGTSEAAKAKGNISFTR